jgi:hypothetical protein
MAKTLNRPIPTSSVATLLDLGIGAQVIARPQQIQPPSLAGPAPAPIRHPELPQPQVLPTGEIPDVSRQFMLTASTDRTLKRLIAGYSDTTGLDVKHSEMLRAILLAVENAMPHLLRAAQEIGPLRRPKNDRGKESQREEMERRIAHAVAIGMRICQS